MYTLELIYKNSNTQIISGIEQVVYSTVAETKTISGEDILNLKFSITSSKILKLIGKESSTLVRCEDILLIKVFKDE